MSDTDNSRSPGKDPHLRYPLPTGTRVDHYIIREVIGAGGFGITYLAEHEGLGKLYAIKEYFPHEFSVRQGRSVRPTSSGDGTYKWGLERFLTEARALAKFKHPAIVDVSSIFEANGTAYIVLNYEAGLDLAQWLKQLGRPPTQDELDRILMPLLSALEEVHHNNMMHRDISPDNLLIRDDGRPVLIDFGSARESIRNRARALSAIVKHGYSPPEQYSSRPELQGPWTDIYALSATLFRALTGKLPPEAPERMLQDDMAPLRDLVTGAYRPSFLDAIDQGLRLRIQERPQSVVEWRELLFKPQALRQGQPSGSAARATGSTGQRGSSGTPSGHVAAGNPSGSIAGGVSGLASQPSRRPVPGGDGRYSQSGGSSSPGHSARAASSIPKSERPDLSWLDAEDPSPDEEAAPAPQASVGQTLTYALMGGVGGALAGAALAVVVASAISTECFASACIYRYLAGFGTVGTIAGLFIGVKLGHRPATSADSGQGSQA